MFEPVIAIAASPRDWSPRLQRHVAVHGGARVRAAALRREDALDESFEVFLVDDTTSFLTPRLIMQLHHQGRQVLGVYEDLRGRRELIDLGVDQAIGRAASTEELLAAVSELAAHVELPVAAVPDRRAKRRPRRWTCPALRCWPWKKKP